MAQFKITKYGFQGNVTGSLQGNATSADTAMQATMIVSGSGSVLYDSTSECFKFVFA